MGVIVTKGATVVAWLSELIGTKVGLVVNEIDLDDALTEDDESEPWLHDRDTTVRLRSEYLCGTALQVLARFGDSNARHVLISPVVMPQIVSKYPNFDDILPVTDFVIEAMDELVRENKKSRDQDNVLNPARIVNDAEVRWGKTGGDIAGRLIAEIGLRSEYNAFQLIYGSHRPAYDNVIQLRALFDSDQLPIELGQFIDQRFIDFLHTNLDEGPGIHWRQFEGLVSERLQRLGLEVEIGPGRNDDGVDIRAWMAGDNEQHKALLLVQCKREKAKTSKVVVKAMAADVAFEGAKMGLVATTSEWSPGARETVRLRNYTVSEANKIHVAKWLTEMRTPTVGTWLSALRFDGLFRIRLRIRHSDGVWHQLVDSKLVDVRCVN